MNSGVHYIERIGGQPAPMLVDNDEVIRASEVHVAVDESDRVVGAIVKVVFFRGGALSPPPPVESRQPEVRYLHIHEGDEVDEAQLSRWVRQASKLPGWDGA